MNNNRVLWIGLCVLALIIAGVAGSSIFFAAKSQGIEDVIQIEILEQGGDTYYEVTDNKLLKRLCRPFVSPDYSTGFYWEDSEELPEYALWFYTETNEYGPLYCYESLGIAQFEDASDEQYVVVGSSFFEAIRQAIDSN